MLDDNNFICVETVSLDIDNINFTLQYFLCQHKVKDNAQNYDIKVTKTRTDYYRNKSSRNNQSKIESEIYYNIKVSEEEITLLITMLARNFVTPVSLSEIIADYLH